MSHMLFIIDNIPFIYNAGGYCFIVKLNE